MKELTKEQKVKVLQYARNIIMIDDVGMCDAIVHSLAVLFGIQQEEYMFLPKYFPEFNFEIAVEMFGADGDYNWYWWSNELDGIWHRLDYFDYLIKLYSE